MPIWIEYGGTPKKVKDVELPEPMTSNQFNEFIISPEGKEWAKPLLMEEINRRKN